jgi:2-oxoglutarate ferredoxin oxidoreductase subunit gamma
MRTEIRIAGTGGMGVVLAGVILGHASAVYANMETIQSQSYGSEARGTAAKSEVIISDGPIWYPKVRASDYLIAMSQKALDMYLSGAKEGSAVIVDPDLVDTSGVDNYDVVKVSAMKTADELGMRLVSNMVMLGALLQKSGLFPLEYLEKALRDLVSVKTLQLDVDAARAGAKLI